MAGRQSFGAYLKAAFTNHWNLLALFGTVSASVISGRPDVFLPLVVAAEAAFLGMVSTNPRFHRAVDAQHGAAQAAQGAEAMRERFQALYRGLDANNRRRFDELTARCEILRDLAGKSAEQSQLGFDTVAQAHLSGVNKLLWVYLKLLHTRMTLERFFLSISPQELDRLEMDAKRRMEELAQAGDSPIVQKKRKSLEDTLATVAARRDNIKRARENLDYVSLELERIGAKLSGIAELAVNRQDPDILTHDVDDVARSVEATEEAISEMQAITGLSAADDPAPEILAAQRTRVAG